MTNEEKQEIYEDLGNHIANIIEECNELSGAELFPKKFEKYLDKIIMLAYEMQDWVSKNLD